MRQILLFGVMAVEIKRKAPRAHTVLELVRKRWGHVANIVRPCFHLPTHLTMATSIAWSSRQCLACPARRTQYISESQRHMSEFSRL